MSDGAEADIRSFACAVQGAETWLKLALQQYPLTTRTAGLKGFEGLPNNQSESSFHPDRVIKSSDGAGLTSDADLPLLITPAM